MLRTIGPGFSVCANSIGKPSLFSVPDPAIDRVHPWSAAVRKSEVTRVATRRCAPSVILRPVTTCHAAVSAGAAWGRLVRGIRGMAGTAMNASLRVASIEVTAKSAPISRACCNVPSATGGIDDKDPRL